MKRKTTDWWILDDRDIARRVKVPAMCAMTRIGLDANDRKDVMNITLAAILRIAERKRAGDDGRCGGLYQLAYRIAWLKSLRPLKCEMVPRAKRELLALRSETRSADRETGEDGLIDPLEELDAAATMKKLARPASWRAFPPYAGIDAKAFLDFLNADARALLVDLVACGDSAWVTAARLADITGKRWTARRVKRMRARLRIAWKSFFGKVPDGGGLATRLVATKCIGEAIGKENIK